MARNLNIPEPTLEEHALIESSAPIPELSAGFRSRVLSDCAAVAAASRRAFRLRVAAVAGTVCCLGLLIYLASPEQPVTISAPVAEADVEEQQESPVRHYSPGRSTSPGLALETARPEPRSEPTQMNEIIEDLTDRKKIFDANMLPGL